MNMSILEEHAELKQPDNIDSGGAVEPDVDDDVDENTRRIRQKRRRKTKKGREAARARGVEDPTNRFDEWGQVTPPPGEREDIFGGELLDADD